MLNDFNVSTYFFFINAGIMIKIIKVTVTRLLGKHFDKDFDISHLILITML